MQQNYQQGGYGMQYGNQQQYGQQQYGQSQQPYNQYGQQQQQQQQYGTQFNAAGMPQVQMANMQMPGQNYPQTQLLMVQLKSGVQKLNEVQGIYIKQKFEPIEALTGCETPNIYRVYPADINGQKIGNKTLFKCKEISDCCSRNCCPGDCRPFNMKVCNEEGMFKAGSFDKTLFLQLERPYKCTCMCFCRPEMSVNILEGGMAQFLGKIKNPCLVCSIGCNVEDGKGNLKYIIEASCCQLGWLCQCFCCKSCQEVNFSVKTPNGDTVCRLQKQTAGCLKACCSDTDNFSLGFPTGASYEDKALLMAATLFLDYMYFENRAGKQAGSSNGALID